MSNDAMQFLKNHIGKEITDSPSPFMVWLKPKMLAVQEGSLTFEYTIRKEMTNPFGTLHGGVIGAMIDDAIGATMISYGEPFFYVTINNVIDYFASAKENDVIIAATTINKKGKTIVNAQCEVWDKDKTRLIAKGYTNLLKTEIKK
ncbi:PaaI family thioesterase [Flavobacterium sp. '19STA2R22 D10 B1']|uniref:PaaI family thioesterase n=1 Tax=Flavobacterium aerium TaxID=3037261 RepID=UPI00278C2F25|nr:PaaI family thioesterase [Flavobacterium sp. '19STA2R22 D10 B1']